MRKLGLDSMTPLVAKESMAVTRIETKVTCIGDTFLAIGIADCAQVDLEIQRIISELESKSGVIVTPFEFDALAIERLKYLAGV